MSVLSLTPARNNPGSQTYLVQSPSDWLEWGPHNLSTDCNYQALEAASFTETKAPAAEIGKGTQPHVHRSPSQGELFRIPLLRPADLQLLC